MDKYYQDIHFIDNIILESIKETFNYKTHTIKIYILLHDHIYIDSNGNKTYSFYGDFVISSKSQIEYIYFDESTFQFTDTQPITSLHISCFNFNGKEYINSFSAFNCNLNNFIKYVSKKHWYGQHVINYKITVNFNFNYKEILKKLPLNDDIVGIILQKYLINCEQ